ncbi:MAG: flavin reductase family protein [Muribaculaceae bacterium]|nr:flavin reductase family protein [Muribaculaceae bacterium]
MKLQWKPGTMVYPSPAALVSCGLYPGGESNLITVAWTGTICTNPPMLYISVRPSRHSYSIIKKNMEFTLNLTSADMVRATDWCGVKSGREFNKWHETGLHPEAGVNVASPSVAESPLSIECKVREIISLGSHDMFLADVVGLLADEKYIDPQTGAFDLGKAKLTAWCHGHYYSLGEMLGHFGFSIKKKQ